MAAATGRVVLPGDLVGDTSSLGAGKTLRLGSGLLQRDEIVLASKAGLVRHQAHGNRFWVDNNQRRYIPAFDDMVLGVVMEKHTESYKLDIRTSGPAVLPALAFEGATKRNRPFLEVGTLVYDLMSPCLIPSRYCRVVLANRDMDPELTCESETNKKGWMTGQSIFGPLEGGHLFETSIGYARSLLSPSACVVNTLGEFMPYELAVGVNGRIWVKAETVHQTILITNAILNAEFLPPAQIRTMVQTLIAREAKSEK